MNEPDILSALAAASAEGIHKRFGSTHALRGVGLSLYPGRCLGRVGRNGAGKSTLVSILSGILAPAAAGTTSAAHPPPSPAHLPPCRAPTPPGAHHAMA